MSETMRVLVTGAAGFIGMHVAHRLLDAGAEVIGADSFDPYYDVALKEATLAMQKLQQDAALISAQIQQLTETSTLELTNVSRDVRTSADTLTTTGQRLSNPRAILFGPGQQQLGPGEKLP